ncbi:hypothetical protein BMETH_902_1 [methanotrophic bacterial endosymbiont of Bathymodiolus sp.]|nr:hypothetical protein BMETH_902_1 [methanotrophic bacterial endosymbiont of Bathymodiolus sp.]
MLGQVGPQAHVVFFGLVQQVRLNQKGQRLFQFVASQLGRHHSK